MQTPTERLTPQQVAEAVKERIRAEPRGFIMSAIKLPAVAARRRNRNYCGTAMCIAGHTLAVIEIDTTFLLASEAMSRAAYALGATDEKVRRSFIVSRWPKRFYLAALEVVGEGEGSLGLRMDCTADPEKLRQLAEIGCAVIDWAMSDAPDWEEAY